MPDSTTFQSLEQRITALTSQNIKADPNHLVESIRRQFPNPDEYSRELVANGVDAGATQIDVRGDIWKEGGAEYARVRFFDNGKGMSFAEMQSYLTVFESHKDGTNQSVGKHGVGKLSPWADRDLSIYIVDTSDGIERTELRMASVSDGVIRRFACEAPQNGTIVSLLWKSEAAFDTLREKLSAAKRILNIYCRYIDRMLCIDCWNEAEKRFVQLPIIVRPEHEGWLKWGEMDFGGTPAVFYYRFGRGSGLLVYQGGIFVAEKKELIGWTWGLEKMAVMIDSQAFNLPISRNDVIEDTAFSLICTHMIRKIFPAIIEKLCRQINNGGEWWRDLSPELAAGIVTDYLCFCPLFTPAQDLPLIPVLPFGYASVNQVRAERQRHGSLMLCRCGGDEFDGVTGRNVVIDENKLTDRMELFLQEQFGPLMRVDYSDDAVEAPAGSEGAELSQLERRFQESLVLLCSDSELERLSSESGPTEEIATGTGIGNSSGSVEKSNYGARHHPDLPDVRFKLTRLVRLDGKTPVSALKFKINGTAVLLNLNHPDIKCHVAFSEKDPDLAAHWCLRELILSDRIECFKHLNYDACETLVLHDAIGRCVEMEQGAAGRKTSSDGKSFWNDDYLDWEKLL